MYSTDKTVKLVQIESTVVPEDEEEEECFEHEEVRKEVGQQLEGTENVLLESNNSISVENQEKNTSNDSSIKHCINSKNEYSFHGEEDQEFSYVSSKKAKQQKRWQERSNLATNVVNHKPVAHSSKLFNRLEDDTNSDKRGDDFDKVNDKNEYDL